MPNNEKIIHDIANSLAIIKSLSKSADTFLKKISFDSCETGSISPKQINIFKESMVLICEEVNKIESHIKNSSDIIK